MPDLRDLSIRQATNLLQEKGLSLAVVSKAHSDEDEGVVISQFPPAGLHVSDLGQVELLVSLGGEQRVALMSDFTGLSIGQAKKEIVKAGFAGGKIIYENRPGVEANTVFAQNPPHGMPTPEGAEVELSVGQPARVLGNPATYVLYRFTLPANAGSSAVRVVREGKDGKKQDIFNGASKGGETISLMVDSDGAPVVRVYLNEKLTEQKQF
jgi:beta-lactam-binding protein with PASTA domain